MIVRQRAYTRCRGGEAEFVGESRTWTADDYDLIEELIEKEIPFSFIRLFFTPSPSEAAMRSAAYRAGFKSRLTPGRPTKAMYSRWMTVLDEWKEAQR